MWHWTTVLVVMMPWLQKRSLELAVSEIHLKKGYMAIMTVEYKEDQRGQ